MVITMAKLKHGARKHASRLGQYQDNKSKVTKIQINATLKEVQ